MIHIKASVTSNDFIRAEHLHLIQKSVSTITTFAYLHCLKSTFVLFISLVSTAALEVRQSNVLSDSEHGVMARTGFDEGSWKRACSVGIWTSGITDVDYNPTPLTFHHTPRELQFPPLKKWG